MNPEKLQSQFESKDFDLSFELDTSRENKDWYNFKNVSVIIDRSGKNFEALPELMFGTYDEQPNHEMLNQPTQRRTQVNMDYVAACIKKVAEVSGERDFWFYPHGEDVSEERKGAREAARQKLFSKFVTMRPGPDNFGYIISV